MASFTLFTAIMMAATFTACSDDDNPVNNKPFNEGDATPVTNDAELRSAITNGANIQLAIDIDLSNSTLNIAEGITVTITGGTVHASAGEGGTGNRAIGPGKGCDAYGQLTIGDLMMVRSERLAAAEERKICAGIVPMSTLSHAPTQTIRQTPAPITSIKKILYS